jgi:hypothetical protein
VVRSRFASPLAEIAHKLADRLPGLFAAGHAAPMGADEPYEGVASIDRRSIVFARTIYAVYQ